MKLFSTLSGEKGKSVSKCGNDYIKVYFSVDYKEYKTLYLRGNNGTFEIMDNEKCIYREIIEKNKCGIETDTR